MPFKSEKQRRYLWAKEPEIARRWTSKYGGKPETDALRRRAKARRKKKRRK